MAELIWDGKYDAHGNKRAPVRIELPFQTVETVNESVQERQRTLELSSSGHDPEWRNRLIWGDKKYILPSLLPEFAGKVDLIYIDPPFDTGADFSFSAALPNHDGDHEDELPTFTKSPSILEQKAYRDTWGRGLDSYVAWFYNASSILQDLLASTGSIYVHLDWHVAHYAKAVLDEVFGVDCFANEIIWKRARTHNDPQAYGRIHDSILYYTRADAIFNVVYGEYEEDYVEKAYRMSEAGGRRFQLLPLHSTHPFSSKDDNTRRFGDKVLRPPAGKYWRWSQKKIDEAMSTDMIVLSKNDVPRYKKYLDEAQGVKAQSIWDDTKHLSRPEMLGYPTQKPESLLERVIKASSNENDLVLDCFCGSGTTAAVAEKLNRRWIACDLGRFAIHTTRKRLLGINGVKPFVVQNLGKYERQQWQVAEFAPASVIPSTSSGQALGEGTASRSEATLKSKDPMPIAARHKPSEEFSPRTDRGENPSQGRSSPQADMGSFDSVASSHSRSSYSAQDDRLREQKEREAAYRKFILELYHATPVSGHAWLHGVKSGRMVHVAAVDAPVTRADVNSIAAEVWKAAGKGANSPQKPAVDILGWEFALELNETAKEVAAQARVDAAFKKIPREVLEKKAVEQGDVHFFELGALSVDAKVKKRELTLTLSDFVIPLDDVPAEVRSAIKHWSQMVDYWAVDWDFKDDTFHNQWQSYRTRKNPKLELSKGHGYAEPGHYTVVVKVIDILGNDTTKTLNVDVK